MKQYAQSEPIDFVVPWVDGSDPEWHEARSAYQSDAGIDADDRDFRYRDWGIFKYWFRSVETYAPWVNRIHLVTSGHVPSWLDRKHPKLHLVKHEDYIPQKYLPTFSSHTIELNMHRIHGLSRKFVYFNDDIFLSNNVSPDLYFRGDLPTDAAIMNALNGSGFSLILMNDIRIVNRMFSKRKAIRDSPRRWFTFKYGAQGIRNLLLLPWQLHTGFSSLHMPNSYLKSTLERVWEAAPDELDATCRRRFRSDHDVNQYLFRYWQLAVNGFHPVAKQRHGAMIKLGIDPVSDVLRGIRHSHKPHLCLNDHAETIDDVDMDRIRAEMETRYPTKSRFEI
ncbi:MAG TPA: Stealth CR1 domain-containing protein [Oleiagrimonas sp.]|nr:Stealth CR1 domain-containing protein [Oleiagrimonas sp.]